MKNRHQINVQGDSRDQDREELIQELYRQLGQLNADLNWLKKKSGIKP